MTRTNRIFLTRAPFLRNRHFTCAVITRLAPGESYEDLRYRRKHQAALLLIFRWLVQPGQFATLFFCASFVSRVNADYFPCRLFDLAHPVSSYLRYFDLSNDGFGLPVWFPGPRYRPFYYASCECRC